MADSGLLDGWTGFGKPRAGQTPDPRRDENVVTGDPAYQDPMRREALWR